jgi:hypothetical protein
VVPTATLVEKRIAAIAVRPSTFVPSTNNGYIVTTFPEQKMESLSKIRL